MNDDKLNRIEDKIDNLIQKQEDMNIVITKNTMTLGANTESLIIHEKRTTLAEARLNMLERKVIFVDAGIKLLAIAASCALFIKKMLA